MLSYVVRVLVVNVVLSYLPVSFALLYILVGSIFFIIMCVCVYCLHFYPNNYEIHLHNIISCLFILGLFN